MCWFPEGPVLQESIGSLQRMLGWGNCLHEILLSTAPSCSTGQLVALPPTGYFHWLLESLPAALRAFDAEHRAALLVHPNSPQFVRDGVRLFFAELQEGDLIVQRRPVAAASARVAAIGSYSGFVPAGDVALLRERAGALLTRKCRDSGKLLYVSRRLARARSEAAPQSLDRVFQDLGYEVLAAETLDLAAQIRLFSSARTIAGLHGAGLANMIWAPPGSRIVELFPAGVFNDCYARLALTCGHSYSYCVLEPAGLDVDRLRRLLNEA